MLEMNMPTLIHDGDKDLFIDLKAVCILHQGVMQRSVSES